MAFQANSGKLMLRHLHLVCTSFLGDVFFTVATLFSLFSLWKQMFFSCKTRSLISTFRFPQPGKNLAIFAALGPEHPRLMQLNARYREVLLLF